MDSDARCGGDEGVATSARLCEGGSSLIADASGQCFRRPSGIVRLDELVELCVRGSLGGDQAIVGSR